MPETITFEGRSVYAVCPEEYDEMVAELERLRAAQPAVPDGNGDTRIELLKRLRVLCTDLIPDDTIAEVHGSIEVDDIISCLIGTMPAHPAVHVQPEDMVPDICNAYESGVGHAGRPTASVNPYPPGTPQHTAYEIGASGGKHNAQDSVPEGFALVEVGILSDRLMAAAMKDAQHAHNLGAPLSAVLHAAIHAYLLEASRKEKK